MSGYLWKYYLEDDVESFRRLLANANSNNRPQSQISNQAAGASPGALGAGLGDSGEWVALSPKAATKGRKVAGLNLATSTSEKWQNPRSNLVLTRSDINSKDEFGLTILHHAASSVTKSAFAFAMALLEHPLIDLYIQDRENGWSALHRSLYFGNIAIARAIIDRDTKDALGQFTGGAALSCSGTIKLKDREGFSPFDVLASTISHRILGHKGTALVGSSQPEDFDIDSTDGDSCSNSGDALNQRSVILSANIEGDELFAFGSNKNLTLGFGDGDDRQYPERVTIKRPDHLFHRFYREYHDQKLTASHNFIPEVPQQAEASLPKDVLSLPSLIRNSPLGIRDVALSKLHSAVLTTDPESNLYICGFGAGGRLGTGDEITRFNFVCIEGGGLAGKKIVFVGLGLNHTLAVDSEGEVFSWGSNVYGQLGYILPGPKVKDQEPVQTIPRQIFGPLKRELVVGVAASRLHSAVHTSTALFTFGKNEGQLGLVDSDARSLEIQSTPRRVGASQISSPIRMVSAIDRATVCLLENHEVWFFLNYGFAKMSFPPEVLPKYLLKKGVSTTRHNRMPIHITKIASGGDTVCAMSSMGDVFTVAVQQKLEHGSTTSTTNPTKIRNALAQPKRVWSLRKGHMAVRDVDVGEDGSVIICTQSGSVWRRVKRVKTKTKDSSSFCTGDYKLNGYKFSRVPGLTRVTAVRSNTFGAYAAVRRDSDVPKTQINVEKPKLWDDLAPLLPFQSLLIAIKDQERMRWPNRSTIMSFLSSPDLEQDMSEILSTVTYKGGPAYDVEVYSSAIDITIPAHRFMLAARSPILRAAFSELQQSGPSSISDLVSVGHGEAGVTRLGFRGVDFLSILNFVLSVYTDSLIEVWRYTRLLPGSAFRFRQIRSEMMRIGSCLELRSFEMSVRAMVMPPRTLHTDMELAIGDPRFFNDGDAIVELAGSEVTVHSVLMCQRCPFFEGLFRGRAAGGWLSSRRGRVGETSGVIKVDLKHVDPVVFKLVLRHVYADTGEELFDDVLTADMDEFLDLVMDVLSVANELMLDRLSQICQKALGRFVTTRNACQLLNAVAPCSVTQFKDVLLEYLCLNLEAMLENHLLDELDEDLLLELDQVVRDSQLTCLPFVKSGRAELLLHERHPDLAATIDRERQAKINSFLAQARARGEESRISNLLRARPSGTDGPSSSPTYHKSRRKPTKEAKASPGKPVLGPKASGVDLIFDMDEEEEEEGGGGGGGGGEECLETKGNSSKREVQLGTTALRGTDSPNRAAQAPNLPKTNVWLNSKGKALSPQQVLDGELSTRSAPVELDVAVSPDSPDAVLPRRPRSPTPGRRWEVNLLPSTKLDMKEIMEQASANRTSNISLGLSSQAKQAKAPRGKISQKERKKQQHQNTQSEAPQRPTPTPEKPPPAGKSTSPWQNASTGPKVSLKEILEGGKGQGSDIVSPHLLVALPIPSQQKLGTAGISTQSPVPVGIRNPSDEQKPPVNPSHAAQATPGHGLKPEIYGKSHQPTPPRTATAAEPPLQLSMADIISQQQLEQEIIKGTVMKRSLQEIQQEQEFQSWWDAESAKVREEAEASARIQTRSSSRAGRGGGRVRGRWRGRGNSPHRGGRERVDSNSPSAIRTGEEH